MLRPFHTRLRREIERVGGTLDKLIGDAVMAVVGIPAVHEDDPERAAFNFGLLEDFDTCTGV